MATTLPAIPPPQTPFEEAVKEILEIYGAQRGIRNADGEYLDRVILFRELVELLSGNIEIITSISDGLSSIVMNDPVDKVLVSGVITVDGPGLVTVYSESGVADAMTQIAGLSKGQWIDIVAASGHTITLTASATLKLPSPTWILSGYRIATFQSLGGGICTMRTHEANIT